MNKYLMFAAALLLASGIMASQARADAVNDCKSCHTFDRGGENKSGPNLFDIIGRKSGYLEDFKYGSYLKTTYFTWDEAKIRAWIKDSQAVARAAGESTKMPSQHITGAKADQVIAFLKAQR